MSILTEYDEEKHMRLTRKQSREEGREEGRKEGIDDLNSLNRWLIEQGRQEDLIRSAMDNNLQAELLEEYRRCRA